MIAAALVRNRDDAGVDTVTECGQAAFGLRQALLALEPEWLGHNRYGQRAKLACQACDDGAAPVPVPPPSRS